MARRSPLPAAALISAVLSLGVFLLAGGASRATGQRTLDLNVALKAQLLAEANVDHRAQTLLEHLQRDEDELPPSRLKFPPDFSPN